MAFTKVKMAELAPMPRAGVSRTSDGKARSLAQLAECTAQILCVRYVKSQLYEITNVNVPVMIIAIGMLVLAAAIASIIPIPARRRLHRPRTGLAD